MTGSASAMFYLSEISVDNEHYVNSFLGFFYAREAAALGHEKARDSLSLDREERLREEIDQPPIDPKNHSQTFYMFTYFFWEPGHRRSTVTSLRLRAEKGDADAMFYLRVLGSTKEGRPYLSIEEALEWAKQAVSLGLLAARDFTTYEEDELC